MMKTIILATFSAFFFQATLLPFRTQSHAAAPQSNPGAVASNEVTTFKGKLKGMKRGLVLVEKDDGVQAMVAPPDEINAFQFVAKAKPEFLRRGMLLRITGNFAANGLPTSPIDKVTIFQAVPLKSIRGRAKEQFTPGIHSSSKQPLGRNQPVMGKLTIVGGLINLSPQGVITLQAGKTRVQIPVTAETQLEVRYNSLALAQEDDLVNVAGFYNPPNENQVKAERITITTDRVFGEVPPPVVKKRRGKETDEEKPKESATPSEAAPEETMNKENAKDESAKDTGDDL